MSDNNQEEIVTESTGTGRGRSQPDAATPPAPPSTPPEPPADSPATPEVASKTVTLRITTPFTDYFTGFTGDRPFTVSAVGASVAEADADSIIESAKNYGIDVERVGA